MKTHACRVRLCTIVASIFVVGELRGTEQSTRDKQLYNTLEYILPFPKVLLPIVIQYAAPTPIRPVAIIDSEQRSDHYQRYDRVYASLDVWVVGKDPKISRLPLCKHFKVFENTPLNDHAIPMSYATDKKVLVCPENWYPEQLQKDLIALYRTMYPEPKGIVYIRDKSNNTLYDNAPGISGETLALFNYIGNHKIELVEADSDGVQIAKELSLIYLASDHTIQTLFRLYKNLNIYLDTVNKRFLRGGVERFGTYNLSGMIQKYDQQKKIISSVIKQPLSVGSVPLLLQGESLKSCVQYAARRKKEISITLQ